MKRTFKKFEQFVLEDLDKESIVKELKKITDELNKDWQYKYQDIQEFPDSLTIKFKEGTPEAILVDYARQTLVKYKKDHGESLSADIKPSEYSYSLIATEKSGKLFKKGKEIERIA